MSLGGNLGVETVPTGTTALCRPRKLMGIPNPKKNIFSRARGYTAGVAPTPVNVATNPAAAQKCFNCRHGNNGVGP